MDEREHYRAQFAQLNGSAPAWLRHLRQRGFAHFAEHGFPTTRLEEWKYTNVAPIAQVPFRMAPPIAIDAALADAVGRARLGLGRELVFVDGHFMPTLSTPGHALHGLTLGGVAETLQRDPAHLEPVLGRIAEDEGQSFVALNQALFRDGAFIAADRGVTLDEPIHVCFIATGGREARVSSPRNVIVADEDSSVTVLETYLGVGSGRSFTNVVTEILIGANASVAHYRVQREQAAVFHVGSVVARQHAHSHFLSHSVALGGDLVRTDVSTRLSAPGGECTLDGLYMATGSQHIDHHTTIDHEQPHCSSRELYKGVLDGHATGVFNGKVFVRPQAQKSDAQQVNKNLLLSDAAVINTKPQLEIFADDVKCSHGATIGRLDEDALYYLRARGIDAAGARLLLVYGFAAELINRIPVATVRAQLDRVIRARVGGDLLTEADA